MKAAINARKKVVKDAATRQVTLTTKLGEFMS